MTDFPILNDMENWNLNGMYVDECQISALADAIKGIHSGQTGSLWQTRFTTMHRIETFEMQKIVLQSMHRRSNFLCTSNGVIAVLK